MKDSTESGIKNKKIIVYPEIIAESIVHNEVDLYLIWTLAKKVDLDGNGIISIEEIINIGIKILGLKSNYIYNKLNSGVDRFWGKLFRKNGKRYTCLFSLKKIITRYNPKILKCHPVVIPVSLLNSDKQHNTKNIKNLFISIVASRYGDKKPISLASICENLNLSESTIRNALQECTYVKIKNNFQIVSVSEKIENLKIVNTSYKILTGNNFYQLVKQLPNSYILDLETLPIKCRPKELKKVNIKVENYDDKKYHVSNNELVYDNKPVIKINSYNR